MLFIWSSSLLTAFFFFLTSFFLSASAGNFFHSTFCLTNSVFQETGLICCFFLPNMKVFIPSVRFSQPILFGSFSNLFGLFFWGGSALLIPHNFGFQFQFFKTFNALLSNHPALSFPHWVQKSVFHGCVSFAALHVGPSILSFWIPIYVLIYDVSLSDLLHSVQ